MYFTFLETSNLHLFGPSRSRLYLCVEYLKICPQDGSFHRVYLVAMCILFSMTVYVSSVKAQNKIEKIAMDRLQVGTQSPHHQCCDNYNNCGLLSLAAHSGFATINNNVKRTLELKRDSSSLMTKDLH